MSLSSDVTASTLPSSEYSTITLSALHMQQGVPIRFLKVYPTITEAGIQKGITSENVCSYLRFVAFHTVPDIPDIQYKTSILETSLNPRISSINEENACVFDFGSSGYMVKTQQDALWPYIYAIQSSTSLENITFQTQLSDKSDIFANITSQQYGYQRWSEIIDMSTTDAAAGETIHISICSITDRSPSCLLHIDYQGVTVQVPQDKKITSITVTPEIYPSGIQKGYTVPSVCDRLRFIQNYYVFGYLYPIAGHSVIGIFKAGTAANTCTVTFETPQDFPAVDPLFYTDRLYGIKIDTDGTDLVPADIGFKVVAGPNITPDRFLTFGKRSVGFPTIHIDTIDRYTHDPIYFGTNTPPVPYDNAIDFSYTVEKQPCTVDCYSNVMFLPGIMGTRLYDNNNEKLWDTLGVLGGDEKQARLAMDSNGYSIENIHTGADVVGDTAVIGTVATQDIYKSFITDLQKWKNTDHIIADYAVIPYDWRLPLDQIVQKGREVDGKVYYGTTTTSLSDSFIIQQLQKLVDNSKSGKVTIVAHSNGGLVAKELIQTLKETNSPLYNQIDKVIMVGVPQVGTPAAVVGNLHGNGIGALGANFVLSNARSRSLAQNMPMSYNLLPNQNYIDMVSQTDFNSKIVTFDGSDIYAKERKQYGYTIDGHSELEQYIVGAEGRPVPPYLDTNRAMLGNQTLLTNAIATHQRVDSFEAASTTKIIQVAGWGEDTVVGIDYKAYSLGDGVQYPSFKVRKTVDGDGTVVVPSALYTSTSTENVERWWVNLDKFNGILGTKNHGSILEIPELRFFIQSQIQKQTQILNQIVINTQPLGNDIKRLHYTLHSPLTLGIIDNQGRYSGRSTTTDEVINQIEGARYDIYGEVQTISVPVGLAHKVVLDGYDTGSFSLDIDRQEGNTITASTTFSSIPTNPNTIATLAMNESGDIASTTLQVDSDTDGTIDITLQAKENTEVVYTKPKETSQTPQVSYGGGGGAVYFAATAKVSPHASTTAQQHNTGTSTQEAAQASTTTSIITKDIATTSKTIQKNISKQATQYTKAATKPQKTDKNTINSHNISQVASPAVATDSTQGILNLFTKIKNSLKRLFGVQ
ncbi:MAG: hypothetical protein RI996_566 [Candidatus Parcubacteria bacterium]|jgi:pimeloyl-ACP methyl ester carboxylesterase